MKEFVIGEEYKEHCKRLLWLYENAEKGIGLDVGCDNGSTLAIAMAQSRKGDSLFYEEQAGMTGIDIGDHTGEFLKFHPRGDFKQLDIVNQSFPFNDNQFDTVLLCEILEHCTPFYVHRIIDEAYRVSKKVVLITTPDGCIGENYAPDRVEAIEHHMIFTEEIFRNFLEPSLDMVNWYKLWPPLIKTDMKYKYELTRDGTFIFVKIIK